MFSRPIHFALALLTLAPILSAADPLVGAWKLNRDKSDFTGQTETIASLGNNKYRFTYGSAVSFVTTADGTDQPSTPGSTVAITIQDPNTWKIVSKSNGGPPFESMLKLSPDSKTITSEGSAKRPDGSDYKSTAELKRVSGSSGFAGTWQVTNTKSASEVLLRFDPTSNGGLEMSWPKDKVSVTLSMDGKDCLVTGPTVPADSTTSAKRVGANGLHMVDKLKGKEMDTVDLKVSPDGKVLTMTEHDAGIKKTTVSVYDRT